MITFDSHDADLAKLGGVGFMGGMLSALPSWKILRWHELFLCGFSGLFVTVLGTPAIRDLIWKDIPESVFLLIGGTLALGAPAILATITAYWKLLKDKKYLEKAMKAKFGTPTSDDLDPTPTPLPPTRIS